MHKDEKRRFRRRNWDKEELCGPIYYISYGLVARLWVSSTDSAKNRELGNYIRLRKEIGVFWKRKKPFLDSAKIMAK